MKNNLAIWLYGSKARGDQDELSDIDILVVGNDIEDLNCAHKLLSNKNSQSNFSFYLWTEIEAMAKYGSLFLRHLKLEGQCLYEGEVVKGHLLQLLSKLPEYKRSHTDIKSFLQVIRETKDSFISGTVLVFDLSVLATVIRHSSILGCYLIGKPCFERFKPFHIMADRLHFSESTVKEYHELYKYKLYIEKRIEKNIVDKLNISPKTWLKNTKIIVNEVKGVLNGKNTYN